MKKNFNHLCFYLKYCWAYGIALLPFWWLYRLSDMIFIIVYYVFRYRRKVVYKNLKNAFPEKTVGEHQKIAKDFYRYIGDLVVEMIKNLTITKKQMQQRLQFHNIDVLQKQYIQQQHIILLLGHFGNWEWLVNGLILQTSYLLHAVYKPLHNLYFDELVYRLRTRFGRKLIEQNDTLRAILQYNSIPKITIFLTDQAPSPQNAYVTMFLNQRTHCFKGPEKIARKLNYAVVYASTQRIKRGYYKIYLSLLAENPRATQENEITEWYMQKLEEDIQRQPATWLWSHRRWKHKNK